MVNQSTLGARIVDRVVDRRTVLQAGAAMAATGPALLGGAYAEAQPRPRSAAAMTIIDSQVHAEIAPELTGHGLPLSKCEAYNRVYEQPYGSS